MQDRYEIYYPRRVFCSKCGDDTNGHHMVVNDELLCVPCGQDEQERLKMREVEEDELP